MTTQHQPHTTLSAMESLPLFRSAAELPSPRDGGNPAPNVDMSALQQQQQHEARTSRSTPRPPQPKLRSSCDACGEAKVGTYSPRSPCDPSSGAAVRSSNPVLRRSDAIAAGRRAGVAPSRAWAACMACRGKLGSLQGGGLPLPRLSSALWGQDRRAGTSRGAVATMIST